MKDTRKPIEATSPSDLTRKLDSWDIYLPERGQGRKTFHTERRTTCPFLHTISKTGLLSYPLRVKPDDRPDLVLELMGQDRRQIGVEITEAIPQNWAWIASKANQNDSMFVPESKIDDPCWTKDKIEKYVETGGKNSPPIMGKATEIRNWKDAILEFAKRKAHKFENEEFKMYQHNWLLIHDNWTPTPSNSTILGVSNRLGKDLYTSDWNNPFDKVFIQNFDMILEFSRQGDPITYPVTFRSKFMKIQ